MLIPLKYALYMHAASALTLALAHQLILSLSHTLTHTQTLTHTHLHTHTHTFTHPLSHTVTPMRILAPSPSTDRPAIAFMVRQTMAIVSGLDQKGKRQNYSQLMRI